MKGLGTCVIGAIALARKATAIAVAAADVPLPTSIEITNIRVFHCPFDVQASVASDLSSIDVTYDTTNGQSSLAAYGSSGQAQQTCYVKVEFDFSPNDEENTASVLQIDYEGAVRLDVDTEARIETQIAWDTMTGPAHYTQVSLKGPITNTFTEQATNSTLSMHSDCGVNNPWPNVNPFPGIGMSIQTIFSVLAQSTSSTGELGKGSILTQRLHLNWLGSCRTSYKGKWSNICDGIDIDGQPAPADSCSIADGCICGDPSTYSY